MLQKIMLLAFYGIYAAPFVGLVTGLLVPPLLIHWISNQWPSSEQFLVMYSTAVLGAVVGGSMGYVLCPYKASYEGWRFISSSWLYVCFGLWIGVGVASWLSICRILGIGLSA